MKILVKDCDLHDRIIRERVLKFPHQSIALKTLIKARVAQYLDANGSDSVEQAQVTAIEDFSQGSYLVFVNGKQILNLEHELRLTPKSDVKFIELIPLRG